MPLFNSQVATNSPLQALYPGDSATLINAEASSTFATGTASLAVTFADLWSRATNALALELIFSANPGAFNFQIQGGDSLVTSDPTFFTEGSGTVTAATLMSDGTYRARVELSPWVARFMRLKIFTQTANPCNITARVTLL